MIFLKDEKVNKLVTKIINSLYPIDDEFLTSINNIAITYYDKIPESKDLPFCYVNTKFINPIKNRLEQYIIFTSKYNLKFLSKASHIFIDATFKVAPKNFYQLINTLVHIEKDKFAIPIVNVLMSNKSLYHIKKFLKI